MRKAGTHTFPAIDRVIYGKATSDALEDEAVRSLPHGSGGELFSLPLACSPTDRGAIDAEWRRIQCSSARHRWAQQIKTDFLPSPDDARGDHSRPRPHPSYAFKTLDGIWNTINGSWYRSIVLARRHPVG